MRDAVLDMVRSLGLIVAVVAVSLIFVPGLLHPGKSQKLPPVDYTDVVTGFHQVTGRAALAPAALPAGWRATSESLTHHGRLAHMHVGFATPDSKYAGLEEANEPAREFIRTVLGPRGLTPTGTTVVRGSRWTTRTSQRGEISLTATSRGVTTVITGSAGLLEQQALAGSLRPQPR